MKKTTILFVLALFCGTVRAQTPVIEYESPLNFKLPFPHANAPLMASGDRLDLTGDGVPELALVREDAQNRPQTFVVVDLTTRQVVWEIEYDEIVNALLGEEPIYFPGFFSFYETGTRVAVFRGETTLGIIHRRPHRLKTRCCYVVHHAGGTGVVDRHRRRRAGRSNHPQPEHTDGADLGRRRHGHGDGGSRPRSAAQLVPELPQPVPCNHHDRLHGRAARPRDAHGLRRAGPPRTHPRRRRSAGRQLSG